MGNYSRPIQLAPDFLTQPILPGWQFSLFRIDLGTSGDPGTEDAVIDAVGSYGRQIGHVAEALEAIICKLGLDKPDVLAADDTLTDKQKQAVRALLDDVVTVRTVKRAQRKDKAAGAT